MAAKTLLCALLLLAAAQPPQKPALKSGVTLVEVDVVISDKSGRPVRGLSREDFEVDEDGQPVEIASFSAVDLPQTPRDAVVPPPDRSGSAFGSNEQADGRLILIVLDDVQVSLTAGRMATVKAVARRAVEGLGPADLAAVMTTSGRLGGQTELTRDKSRLMAAIARFLPQGGHDLPAIASGPPSTTGGSGSAESIADRRTHIRNGWIEYRGARALDDYESAKRRAPHQPGLSGARPMKSCAIRESALPTSRFGNSS